MVVLFKGIKSNATQYGYNDFLDKLLSSAGFKTGYINESYGEGEIKSFCRWKVVQLRYLPYDPFYTRFFWTWIVELLNASGLNEGCKIKSVYLIATRDLRISGCNFFYLKIKGLCDFLRKRF